MADTREGFGHRAFAAVFDAMGRPAERRWLGAERSRLVGDLTGDVLEIGAGTGANLPHYRQAGRVVMVEPAPPMRTRLAAKRTTAQVPIEIVDAVAERLPYDDASFDAVVSVGVLCSVDDQEAALAEARRVLKPGGQLAFIEHVRAAGRRAWWQDRMAPLWVQLCAGCHPNRETVAAIERAGFTIEDIELFSPHPNAPITSPMARGVARTTDIPAA